MIMNRLKKVLAATLCIVFLLCSCNGGGIVDENAEQTTVSSEDIQPEYNVNKKYDAYSAAVLFSDFGGLSALNGDVQNITFDSVIKQKEFSSLKNKKVYDIPASDFYSARAVIDSLIKDGDNIIFAADEELDSICRELSYEYSDVLFFCLNGVLDGGENYFHYSSKTYEAFYLAGVAAAVETETNRIAFISEDKINSPATFANVNAYALGARAVRRNISVYCAFANENRSARAALADLSYLGCDVFAGNYYSDDIYTAAKITGRKIFSYGEKNTTVINENVIGNIFVDLSDFYADVLRKTADGDINNIKNYYSGLVDSAVGLTLFEVSDLSKNIVKTVSDFIVKKSFKIFSGEKLSVNNSGETDIYEDALISVEDENILPAGEHALGEAEIMRDMNFFVSGINVR